MLVKSTNQVLKWIEPNILQMYKYWHSHITTQCSSSYNYNVYVAYNKLLDLDNTVLKIWSLMYYCLWCNARTNNDFIDIPELLLWIHI